MKRLMANSVLKYQFSEAEKFIRLIFVDTNYEFAYFINLNGDSSMPKSAFIKDLEEKIEVGALVEVSDPYCRMIDEDSLPEKYKEYRDRDWKIVDELWNNGNKQILEKRFRYKLINEISLKYEISEKKVLRVLCRFWQRGMTRNSLLPDYKDSKVKGADNSASYKKRGRPRKIEYDGETKAGINVDEEIKEKIKIALDIFYYTKQKKTLAETYICMLERFFSDIYFIDGKSVIKVWSKESIPTYGQFYYWFKKWNDFQRCFITRNSEKAFELEQRPLLGNSTKENFGPGTRYQIDATSADVYLVSTIHRDKIIGRPVVYMIIDVYSRMVTGLYVGLEGPSWIGAMMALDNVMEDKVQFCKRYDIELTEDMWPRSYMPETILADRGEFEGYNVGNLINNLNIKIENTAPYRGDLKGIVERYFRTTNEKIKHTTPGAIQKEFRERGDIDYRLNAKLNLQEFTAIIIYQVIRHNNSINKKYPRELGLISDEVPSIPVRVWEWGMKNRNCGFVKVEKDILRLNILPKSRAVITREGIKFKTLFYSCSEAIEEKWFVNAKRRSIEIVYDPRNIDYIYIPEFKGKSYIKCFLLDKSKVFENLPMEEIKFQQELDLEVIEHYRDNQNQIDVNLEANINKIIKKANENKITSTKESAHSRLKNIKLNRSDEKDKNRIEESFELGKKDKSLINSQAINEEMVDNSCDMYIKNDNKLSLLKQIRDENLGK